MNNLLNIITPFKSNNIRLLVKSIDTLAYQKLNNINHIFVCDIGCYSLVNEYFGNIKYDFSSLYKYSILKTNKEGVYNAINIGLNELENNSFYLVLGAGDKIVLNKSYIFNKQNDFFLVPYSTSDNPKKLFTKIRNICSGIPYCHNAIIFKKNNIKYNTNYLISADYLYFLEYLDYVELSGKFKFELVNSFEVLVETKFGLSSSNRRLKNIENLKIIYDKFSLKGILFYLTFASLRFFKLIFNKLILH